MKATDLMIGDWVKVHFGVHNKNIGCEVYGQVAELYDDGRIEVAVNGAPSSYWNIEKERGDEILPILLTTEILEKNGFVPIRQNAGNLYYWHYFDKNDGSIVNAFRRIYRGLWIECSNATTEASTSKQCEFVHELQHAIKNTEIEMEVVIC